MSAAVSRSEPACLQRARGQLVLGFRRRGAASVLARLRQEGCLKARLPAVSDSGRVEAVLLNSSGGVADGDVLTQRIALREGARATIATQAAERIYRAVAGHPPARIHTRFDVAAGASAEWLPQETILFDGAALDRALEIELDGSASFLGVEWLLFGRAAMGEFIRHGWLRDRIILRRNGRMVLRDAIRMEGDMSALLVRAATGNGARAVATIILASPDAGTRIDALRPVLGECDAEAGVSAWDGMLVARLAARDGASLRRAVVAGLAMLRDGRPLPRVWTC